MTRIVVHNMQPETSVAVAPPHEFTAGNMLFGQADGDGVWWQDVPSEWWGQEVEVRIRKAGWLPEHHRIVIPSDSYVEARVAATQQRDVVYQSVPDRITVPNVRNPSTGEPIPYPDIRQLLSDNCIQDMLQEEDERFIRTVNCVSMQANPISIPFLTEHGRRLLEEQRRSQHTMEFFAYEMQGQAIGHVGGLARANFD